jgi:hypothetical protein
MRIFSKKKREERGKEERGKAEAVAHAVDIVAAGKTGEDTLCVTVLCVLMQRVRRRQQ